MSARNLNPKVVIEGSNVMVHEDSRCAYVGRVLTVKRIYTKNGNRCADLIDSRGEFMVGEFRTDCLRVAYPKLNRTQIGIIFDVKERAKKGNVTLRSWHLKKARELVLLNVATTSFPIYRMLLGMRIK